MDNKKIISIRGNKRKIFGTIDGNMVFIDKSMTLVVIESPWLPAFAGMTMHVGGNSHQLYSIIHIEINYPKVIDTDRRTLHVEISIIL